MAFEINGVTQPSQAVEEWTDEDYKKNLRFLGSQYNQMSNNVPLVSNGQLLPNGSISSMAEYKTTYPITLERKYHLHITFSH